MKNNSSLIFTILAAAIIIGGAMVYMGSQMGHVVGQEDISEEIGKGIEKYVNEQTAKAQTKGNTQQAGDVKGVSEDDHIRGNKDAEITLIEYSDFECPFCKRFHPTAQKIVDSFNGKVNWVYRQFPLSFHDPLATKEALATECVNELGGNDTFWEYADKLYEKTTSGGNGLQENDLSKFAVDLGINKKDFQDCLDDQRHMEKVLNDIKTGKAAGVTGTPGSILMNNKTGKSVLIPGAQPFEVFENAINELMKE